MIKDVIISTETGDFEKKSHEYDDYVRRLLVKKEVYFEKTPNGVLVAASGVISQKSTNMAWNSFLFGKIPKSYNEITETDLQEWYSAVLQKESSLGLHIDETDSKELLTLQNLFDASGKKRIQIDSRKIDPSGETEYRVPPDVYVLHLISDILKSDKVKSVGLDLLGENKQILGDIKLRYGYAPKKQSQHEVKTAPKKQEKESSFFKRLLEKF